MKTRQEHMDWCKQRAREYLDQGDAQNAINSMISDLRKHPETAKSMELTVMLGLSASMAGTVDAARKFVEGFN